jgi:hypothetical protein
MAYFCLQILRPPSDVNRPQLVRSFLAVSVTSRVLCERSNTYGCPKKRCIQHRLFPHNRRGAFIAQQRLFAYKPRCSAPGSDIRTSSYRLFFTIRRIHIAVLKIIPFRAVHILRTSFPCARAGLGMHMDGLIASMPVNPAGQPVSPGDHRS